MARTYAIQRSTSRVATVDTVNNLITPLGPALANVPISSTLYPIKVQNTQITFLGDPYVIVPTITSTMEVRRFDGLNWVLSSPVFPQSAYISTTPILGIFNIGDTVTSGGATGTLTNISGSLYTVSVVSGVFPTSGILTDSFTSATANITATVNSVQTPTCLQIVNNVLVAIWNDSAGTNSRMRASTTVDGVVWTASDSSSTNAALDSSYGGASVVWRGAVFFATGLGIGNYMPGSPSITIDSGSLNQLTEALPPHPTPQGSMAYWNGILYFVKPATGAAPVTVYTLASDWVFGAPVPQWNRVDGVTGILSSGVMLVGNDIGNYCLFVNKVNELCLIHSGQISTRLAKSTVAAFPKFTDITTDNLPAEIAAKPNLGATVYIDTRRRLNELQWFFIRDSSVAGNSTTLCKWDGLNPFETRIVFTGHDYTLTSDRLGHVRTFTGVQPGDYLADVFVSSVLADRTYVEHSPPVGSFLVGDTFSTTSAALGTIAVVSGKIFGLTVTAGTVLSGTTITNTTVGPRLGSTTTVIGNPMLVAAFPGRAVLIYLLRDTLSRNIDVFGEYSILGDQWLPMTEGGGDHGAQALSSSPTGTPHVFYWDAFADLDGNLNNISVRVVDRIAVSSIQAPINPFVAVLQEGYLRPPVTRSVSQLNLPFTPGSFTGLSLTLTVVAGFNLGDTVTAGGAVGIITNVTLSTIRINVTVGFFPVTGNITDTTTVTTTTITSSSGFIVGETVTGGTSGATGIVQYQSTANVVVTNVIPGIGPTSFLLGETITGANLPLHTSVLATPSASGVVTTTTLPADESTDVEEFHQASSTVTRGHAQFVFQGRLSSNQTRIRFLKLTMRGVLTSKALVSVYVSGQGAVNQYLPARPFSSFQTLPTADQEIIISNVDLLNQPSVLGKKYSIVVEFDLNSLESAVVSTPFFRHE